MQPDPNLLKSWKEIANYFDVNPSTVQRWEKHEGLPVHRQEHQSLASVFAYVSELEEWRRSRLARTVPVADLSSVPPGKVAAIATPSEPVPAAADLPPIAEPGRRSTRRAYFGALLVPAALALGWRTLRRRNKPRLRPIATGLAQQSQPSVSADGHAVAYIETDTQGAAICWADLRSGAKRELARFPAGTSLLALRISRDGQVIAYLRLAEKGLWAVETLDIASLKRRTLTLIDGAGLDWAPDSQWLAITSVPEGGGPVSVYAMRPISGERRRLTSPPAGTWGDLEVAVSPDGTHFAAARYQGRGDGDLWICSWDGRTSRRVTKMSCWINGLCFTPDGRHLIFSPVVHSAYGPFYVAVQGGTPQPIETPGGLTPVHCQIGGTSSHPVLAFQNDSSYARVYHSKLRGGIPEDPKPLLPILASPQYPVLAPDLSRIAWMDSEGVYIATKTQFRGQLVARVSGVKRDLRWSPGGSHLALASQQENVGTWIWIVDAHTGRFQRLTEGKFTESCPIWSVDGTWIYWRSDRDGRWRFWRQRWPGGGTVEPVSPEASDGAPADDERHFYYLDNDQRSQLRVCEIGSSAPPQSVEEIPPQKPGLWRLQGKTVIYADANDSSEYSKYYAQELGSKDRRLIATIPVPTSRGHSFSFASDLSEVVWDRQENNSDVWILEDFLPPV